MIDFPYLLMRLNREAHSPTGQALQLVFVQGKVPAEAARSAGLPMVRFNPVYDAAVKIVSAMMLTEADGFTADELKVAQRALAVSRAKEMAFVPTQADYIGLEHLFNRGGKAIKAMNGTVDELPVVPINVLCALESGGAVRATPLGGLVMEWEITDAGLKLRDNRFR